MQRSNLQTGIWLIGIGILALTGFWWPGIMFVIGISALANGSIQGAIWLFGIGILAWFDFWWPGILFLVGIGIIAGSLRPFREQQPTPVGDGEVPDEIFPESPVSSDEFPEESFDNPPISTAPPPVVSSSRSWLPARCPACGAPITTDEVIWLGADRAECPYCHTHLQPTGKTSEV
ncbi:MAG TPA: hypothetical protein VI451_02710 [Anaerolineales bacterium]|nr:hypothetical protein [Anaerolineales bacterium]